MQTAEEGRTLSPSPATGPADSAKGPPHRTPLPPPHHTPPQVSPSEPRAGRRGIQGHLWNFQRLASWQVRAGRVLGGLPPASLQAGLAPAVDPGSGWTTAGIRRDADQGSAGSADQEPQAAGWGHARRPANQLPVWLQLGSSGKLRQGCLLKQGT